MVRYSFYDVFQVYFFQVVLLLGIYSATFIMYLQCTLPLKNSKVPNIIVLCALCLLYVLSTVNFFVDLLLVNLILDVSTNKSTCKNINFLSVVQNPINPQWLRVGILILQTTIVGCCDFLSQCILVRICHCLYHHPFNSTFKDLPLLDSVGSKYQRLNHSFIHGFHILRSVNLSQFY